MLQLRLLQVRSRVHTLPLIGVEHESVIDVGTSTQRSCLAWLVSKSLLGTVVCLRHPLSNTMPLALTTLESCCSACVCPLSVPSTHLPSRNTQSHPAARHLPARSTQSHHTVLVHVITTAASASAAAGAEAAAGRGADGPASTSDDAAADALALRGSGLDMGPAGMALFKDPNAKKTMKASKKL